MLATLKRAPSELSSYQRKVRLFLLAKFGGVAHARLLFCIRAKVSPASCPPTSARCVSYQLLLAEG